MTNDLERALREEFAGRVESVPATPDLVDVVITRAKRTRRRQRIASGAAACLLLVVGSVVGVKFLYLDGNDPFDIPGGNTNQAVDPPDDFSQLVGGEEGQTIVTPSGEELKTGMAEVMVADEVEGGWLVDGNTTDTDARMVRYIGYDGAWTDLASGDVAAFTNETGELAVVEQFSDPKAGSVTMYEFSDDASADELKTVELPIGYAVDGMSGQNAWLASQDAATMPIYWPRDGDLREVETKGFDFLAPLADGRVLSERDDGDDSTFCPSVVEMVDGSYAYSNDDQCYADLMVESAAISAGGKHAIIFVRDIAGESGEWVTLSFLYDSEGGMATTGYADVLRAPLVLADGTLDGRLTFACCPMDESMGANPSEDTQSNSQAGFIPRRALD